MSWASRCTVRRNGHHVTVVLLRYDFFSYPAIMYFKPEFVVSFALHHMWKAWRKQEKKSVGSWFDAESASPLGGKFSQLKQHDLVCASTLIWQCRTHSFFIPSSEYQPLPISRTAISRSFFST